jgi:hypothetical protein
MLGVTDLPRRLPRPRLGQPGYEWLAEVLEEGRLPRVARWLDQVRWRADWGTGPLYRVAQEMYLLCAWAAAGLGPLDVWFSTRLQEAKWRYHKALHEGRPTPRDHARSLRRIGFRRYRAGLRV